MHLIDANGGKVRHTVLSETHHNNHTILEISKEEDCQIFDGSGTDHGYHQYGNDWWTNLQCPYAFKYLSIDSMYPDRYFGDGIGHPDYKTGSEIYTYMRETYSALFGRNFDKVLELGTGGGEITVHFAENRNDYLAVEGTESGVNKLLSLPGIDPARVKQFNLKFMPNLGEKFDLVMCTEVAEHIEPFFASKIVENCVVHSDVVWFSAADRNRPAHYHHINELPAEAWDNLFAHMGHTFIVQLNGMHDRASRLYMSEELGKCLPSLVLNPR